MLVGVAAVGAVEFEFNFYRLAGESAEVSKSTGEQLFSGSVVRRGEGDDTMSRAVAERAPAQARDGSDLPFALPKVTAAARARRPQRMEPRRCGYICPTS